jgi:hypothetical protein
VCGDGPNSFPVDDPQHPEGGFTEVCGLVKHRVEHGSEIAGRGVDDAEHFGGRGLLFARLCQLSLKGIDTGLKIA